MKYLVALIVMAGMIACGGPAKEGSRQKLGDTGYEYMIHSSAGNTAPSAGDFVDFEMELIGDNGEVIQSMRNLPQMPNVQIPTESSPAEMKSNPIINLLSILGEGDSASVYVPIDSMPSNLPNIGEMAEVLYTVVPRSIMTKEEKMKKQDAERAEAAKMAAQGKQVEAEKLPFAKELLASHLAGKLTNEVKQLKGGLKAVMIENGSGKQAAAGKVVDVHYVGMLKDGKMFDNSFGRGQLFSFTLGQGQVIEGWDEGIAAMKEGDSALLDIPFEMAYGANGRPPTIPAKADLYFYVELKKVK